MFRALQPGELFLFKLHAPRHSIVGGAFFAHATLLPVSLAWEAFGEANGVASLSEMRQQILRYRKQTADSREDFQIGCILLEQPFFLPEEHWIPAPRNWRPQIVRGRSYDLRGDEVGREIWQQLRRALAARREWPAAAGAEEAPRYGDPILMQPRLEQGSFRVIVTDAYERRCSLTGERVLPVLEAAHIRPYAAGGEHRVQNGLLLRSDLHKLFDQGYVTVTPDYRVEVSRRIREDFENGQIYYALNGNPVRLPAAEKEHPDRELLRWHNEEAYLG